jgi:hypothetical protein
VPKPPNIFIPQPANCNGVTLPDDTLIEYINDLQTCKRSGKINKNTHRTKPDSFSN